MSAFTLLPTKYVIVRNAGFEPPVITIQHRGLTGWAIVCEDDGYVMNRDGEWEYEPQPSSRTAEFFLRTRYATAEDALAMFAHSQGEH